MLGGKKFGFVSNLLYDLRKNPALLIMMIPSVAFFIIFSYMPMVGVYYAFTKYNVRGGLFGSPFVGLKNFEFLFASGKVWTLTANTVLYNVIFIAFGTVLCQTVMFLPHFISMVLVGTICYALFKSNGFINTLIVSMGGETFNFYSKEHAWIWYIIIPLVNFWKSTGYGTVVYLSAIMGISDDLYEAADLDGASFLQQVRHITLPCLRPTIVILFLMNLGGIVRGQFDLFYQLVGNQPLTYGTTDIIDTYVFRAVTESFDVSRGTAIGLYQSIVGLLLVLGSNLLVRRIEPEMALF